MSERGSAELPPSDTTRWVVRRKAAVVQAICDGTITAKEACRRYDLSPAELAEWMTRYEQHGCRGLRVTVKPADETIT